ncbi:MAG: type II secretion system protein [Patescibacteria group bacterium]|jgi:prepilin-type N-terminal cleavage/methylation domain-containing protein
MKKAFTLIEYLVVIAIIGILSAAVVITLSHYEPSISLNGSSRDLVSHLRQAQEETVSSQTAYAILFNLKTSPANYQLLKISQTTTVMDTYSIPSTVTVTLDPTITSNQITFSPDGGPSASGNITFTSGGITKVVSVSPAGVISLQ